MFLSLSLSQTDEYCPMSSPTPLSQDMLSDMQDAPMYNVFKMVETIKETSDTQIAKLQREVKSLKDDYNTVVQQLRGITIYII